MKIELDLHGSSVLIDIVRDARDGSVIGPSRIGRHAESDLLALLNPGDVCFRYRNDYSQTAYTFDLDDGLRASLP